MHLTSGMPHPAHLQDVTKLFIFKSLSFVQHQHYCMIPPVLKKIRCMTKPTFYYNLYRCYDIYYKMFALMQQNS